MSEKAGATGGERSILRYGGLAGILGGLIFILVPIILFGFTPQAPAGSVKVEGGGRVDPAGVVMAFPAARAVIATGNFVNFVSAVMSLALFLALYRALRDTSPAAALFGSALYLMGLGVLFIETVTQVAFDPLSDLYRAPGVTAAQQATLALVWQGTQGIFYEFDTAAVLLLSAGFIVLGVAMYGTPAFGRALGALSSALGTAGMAVILLLGVASLLTAVLLLPVFILLPIFLGWKVYRLSKVV